MSGDISNLMEGRSPAERRDSFRVSFLECGICISTFTEPKFLPCVHTFCKECLSSFIRSVCSIHNPRFNCPTCRENIEIPNPSAPIDQWADQFKHNFLINNLLGIVESAEPSNLQPTLQGKSCFRHPGKPLDFVCVDCNMMICASCGPTLHRSCLQVITLEESVQEKRGALSGFLHVFSSNLSRANALSREHKKEKTNLLSMFSLQKQKILQHSAKVIHQVKEQTTLCLEELEFAVGQYSSELDKEAEEQAKRTEFLRKLCDAAQSLLHGDELHKVFDHFSPLQGYSEQMSCYKEKTASDVQVRQVEFKEAPLPSLTLGITEKKAFTRQIQLQPMSAPPSSPRSLATPITPTVPPSSFQADVSPFHALATESVLELERTFSAKVKGDKNSPSIRDGVSVPGGILVLTDGENKSVKCFYSHGNKEMQSKILMEKPPHGICNYVGNMVAVTVPRAKQIAILTVSPTLILQSTIKTELKFWGITHVGTDAFAVSTCPGLGAVSIHIIDLKGSLLKCVHNGTSLFANPLYMCTLATGDLMVSDCTVPRVSCLRQNGTVLHTCSGGRGCSLEKPMGMADDGKGYLMIVDSQPCLALLDYSGSVTYVMQRTGELKKPKCVAFGQKGTVFVANENGKVCVFKMVSSGPDATVRKTFM